MLTQDQILATITDPRFRALEARRANGEFTLDDVHNRPTEPQVPNDVALYFHKNLFNRAAREMANRDQKDLDTRINTWRVCSPPDRQTQFFNFNERDAGIFVCDAPTATHDHSVTLRYLGEKDGEHLFHYTSVRQNTSNSSDRLIMEGVGILTPDNPKKLGLELSHLGFGSDLPVDEHGNYLDLVPDYREAALLNATPKQALRAMLG